MTQGPSPSPPITLAEVLLGGAMYLLAVPMQPLWPDFELARRGLLLLLLAGCWLWPRSGLRAQPRQCWPLFALAAWALISSAYATNGGLAIEAASHWLALGLCWLWGSNHHSLGLVRALLPSIYTIALVGILQSFGLLLLGDQAEPVSTLGNRNFAAEVLALGGLLCGQALVSDAPSPHLRRGLQAGLLLCVWALCTNGSRSGLLALPLGCLLWLSARSRLLHWLPALALGALLGMLGLLGSSDDPSSSKALSPVIEPAPAPSTIAVRIETWKGCLDMVAAAPLRGQGAGQFEISYPRFRRPTEIQLSTRDHSFYASPESAHNDYLQLLVELGAPGLLLLLLLGGRLGRQLSWQEAAPLLGFALLMGVRAPLTNPVAAAWLCLYLGSRQPVDRRQAPSPLRGLAIPLLLGCVFLGLRPLCSQTLATEYMAGAARVQALLGRQNWERSQGKGGRSQEAAWLDQQRSLRDELAPGMRASLDAALFWRGQDADLRFLRAQLLQQLGENKAAAEDYRALGALAPWDQAILSRRIGFLRQLGENDAALRDADLLLGLDPDDPVARLHRVGLLAARGDIEACLTTLYAAPDQARRWPEILQQLQRAAGAQPASARFALELRWVLALEALEAAGDGTDADLLRDLSGRSKELMAAAAGVPEAREDLRPLLYHALVLLRLNQPGPAEAVAGAAAGRRLPAFCGPGLEPLLKPLRAFPRWQALLPVPPGRSR